MLFFIHWIYFRLQFNEFVRYFNASLLSFVPSEREKTCTNTNWLDLITLINKYCYWSICYNIFTVVVAAGKEWGWDVCIIKDWVSSFCHYNGANEKLGIAGFINLLRVSRYEVFTEWIPISTKKDKYLIIGF